MCDQSNMESRRTSVVVINHAAMAHTQENAGPQGASATLFAATALTVQAPAGINGTLGALNMASTASQVLSNWGVVFDPRCKL